MWQKTYRAYVFFNILGIVLTLLGTYEVLPISFTRLGVVILLICVVVSSPLYRRLKRDVEIEKVYKEWQIAHRLQIEAIREKCAGIDAISDPAMRMAAREALLRQQLGDLSNSGNEQLEHAIVDWARSTEDSRKRS